MFPLLASIIITAGCPEWMGQSFTKLIAAAHAANENQDELPPLDVLNECRQDVVIIGSKRDPGCENEDAVIAECKGVEALTAKWNADPEGLLKLRAKKAEVVQSQVKELAKKHGYRGVVFGRSVFELVREIASGQTKISDTKKIVIETTYQDDSLTAFQVLSDTSALYSVEDSARWVVLFQHGKEQIIENTPLTAVSGGYVVIVGTRIYKTAMGSRQAIVVEPAF